MSTSQLYSAEVDTCIHPVHTVTFTTFILDTSKQKYHTHYRVIDSKSGPSPIPRKAVLKELETMDGGKD